MQKLCPGGSGCDGCLKFFSIQTQANYVYIEGSFWLIWLWLHRRCRAITRSPPQFPVCSELQVTTNQRRMIFFALHRALLDRYALRCDWPTLGATRSRCASMSLTLLALGFTLSARGCWVKHVFTKGTYDDRRA